MFLNDNPEKVFVIVLRTFINLFPVYYHVATVCINLLDVDLGFFFKSM